LLSLAKVQTLELEEATTCEELGGCIIVAGEEGVKTDDVEASTVVTLHQWQRTANSTCDTHFQHAALRHGCRP